MAKKIFHPDVMTKNRHSGSPWQRPGTFEFDAQLGERLLHTLALPLPHEAVVDVHGDHLLLVQGLVEEGRAHRGVHAAAQQHLRETQPKRSHNDGHTAPPY